MKKNIAIVTGAGGGFGREFMRLIAAEKEIDEIWAIARNEKALNEVREELGAAVRIVSLDLSERAALRKIEELLNNESPKVSYLVNNAGYTKFCSFEGQSVDGTLNMIDVNISALVALGLIAIPFMERGSRIINISSQSAFFPLPFQNVYSATKVFVRNYTRSLNVELKSKGITATAVCPGWMKTGLMDRGDIGASKNVTNFFGMKPANKVAAKAFRDAKKGKDMSTYGVYVKFTHLLSKLLPQRLMMKFWCIQQKY
jgi:short-subunit dehydrogenase